jgi:hypothetical protein
MDMEDILEKIEQLPVEKRMLITCPLAYQPKIGRRVEQTLKSIRRRELNARMSKAVEELYEEYRRVCKIICVNGI